MFHRLLQRDVIAMVQRFPENGVIERAMGTFYQLEFAGEKQAPRLMSQFPHDQAAYKI